VHEGFHSQYSVIYKGRELGRIKLNIPGVQYVKNSLVAVTIGMELGIDFKVIKKALEKFTGVYRRFETKYKNDILVLDDYAHHPTETTVTLQGIRAGWDRRLVVVFQPHLYSRTKDFYQDFGRSFLNSDVFICTDVYPARENPIEGVSGEMIANITRKFGHKNVYYLPDKNDIPKKLMELKKKDDIIITMGAGDIWKYGEKFVELLKEEKH
jgi:UDP-N-acetylmuramate--alanine ligase